MDHGSARYSAQVPEQGHYDTNTIPEVEEEGATAHIEDAMSPEAQAGGEDVPYTNALDQSNQAAYGAATASRGLASQYAPTIGSVPGRHTPSPQHTRTSKSSGKTATNPASYHEGYAPPQGQGDYNQYPSQPYQEGYAPRPTSGQYRPTSARYDHDPTTSRQYEQRPSSQQQQEQQRQRQEEYAQDAYETPKVPSVVGPGARNSFEGPEIYNRYQPQTAQQGTFYQQEPPTQPMQQAPSIAPSNTPRPQSQSGAQSPHPTHWYDVYPTVLSSPPEITPTELVGILRDPTKRAGLDYIVVDVRRTDFTESAIPFAVNFPAQSFHPLLDGIVATLGQIPMVVFYCNSSRGRGPRCAGWYQDALNQRGIEASRAYVLDGGIKGWTRNFPDYVVQVL